MPLDTSASTDPEAPWGPTPRTAPALPATWNKYRPNEVLSIGKEGKPISGGFLKGLLNRKDSGSSAPAKAQVKVTVRLASLLS